MPSGYEDIKSSLPLQVALFFHGYYSRAFFVAMLLLFIYKGVMLPYPRAVIDWEVVFIFLWALVEWARLYLASRGNKTELLSPLTMSLALAVPVAVFHIYYLQLQTYVFRLDQILNGISLAFLALEVLLSILAIIAFLRARRF